MPLLHLTAYQLGYAAAAAGQPRQVPTELSSGYPDRRGEWLPGYEDAPGDSPSEQTRTLAGFENWEREQG